MKIKNTKIKVVQGDISKIKEGSILDCSCLQDANETEIRRLCRQALDKAKKKEEGSIVFAFPIFVNAVLPALAIAKIMAQEIFRHLRNAKSAIRQIIFCLPEKEKVEIFRKGVISYLTHVTEVLQNGPFVTVDAIIKINDGFVLVKRSNPPFGWALPGGFVDYGETLEKAISREVKEETGLTVIHLKQFHTYSDPRRDPRFHTIGTVFIAKTKGRLKPGDDAAEVRVVPLSEIKKLKLAFDHAQILRDYLHTGVRP